MEEEEEKKQKVMWIQHSRMKFSKRNNKRLKLYNIKSKKILFFHNIRKELKFKEKQTTASTHEILLSISAEVA